MITIKTKEEIDILREGGKRLAEILEIVAKQVRPGVRASDLNDLAYEEIVSKGDKPSFLNYKPYGAKKAYPATLCVSINDEIVHGIPNEGEKILKEGDIVGLDAGMIHKGLYVDSAVTVPVGNISKENELLIKATKEALYSGISAAKAGKRIGVIGDAIEKIGREYGFSIAEGLAGHGVGYSVHEDPYIPNYGPKNSGEILKVGMVLAIEPMFNIGGGEIKMAKDGQTYKTKDGKNSAHFEHTIVITEKGADILTVK